MESIPARRHYGFDLPQSSMKYGFAAPTPMPGIGGSNMIDMDVLLNEDLWCNIPRQPPHALPHQLHTPWTHQEDNHASSIPAMPVWHHPMERATSSSSRTASSAPTGPSMQWTWVEHESPEADDAACSEVSEETVNRFPNRRQRRRASHNAVERRRRDNINNQIMELAVLLPEHMLSEALSQSMQGGNKSTWKPQAPVRASVPTLALDIEPDAAVPPHSCLRARSLSDAVQRLAPVSPHSEILTAAQYRPNKGIILRKSVTYISELQALAEQQQQRMAILECELRNLYAGREPLKCEWEQIPVKLEGEQLGNCTGAGAP